MLASKNEAYLKPCNYLPTLCLYLSEKQYMPKALATALNKSKKRKFLLFLDFCVRHIARAPSVT
jgi:hypothetical protein